MNETATRICDPLEIEACYQINLADVGTARDRETNKRAVLEGRAALYRLTGPNHAGGVAQMSVIGAGGGDKPHLIVNEISGRGIYTFGFMALLQKLAAQEDCTYVIHDTPDRRKRRVLWRLGFVLVGSNRMAMRVK